MRQRCLGSRIGLYNNKKLLVNEVYQFNHHIQQGLNQKLFWSQADRLLSVSYTHLDVYKRQIINISEPNKLRRNPK